MGTYSGNRKGTVHEFRRILQKHKSMETRTTQKPKPVAVSSRFKDSYNKVYKQGLSLFGVFQAERYADNIDYLLYKLGFMYPYYPECRHLATKSRMYRNIILDAHLIIYRITPNRIEVLDIVHSASSLRRIRLTRNIRIE